MKVNSILQPSRSAAGRHAQKEKYQPQEGDYEYTERIAQSKYMNDDGNTKIILYSTK